MIQSRYNSNNQSSTCPRGCSVASRLFKMTRPRGGCAQAFVIAAVLLTLTAPAVTVAQTLDERWTVSVGGVSVRVNPDGSVRIPNIAAEDSFGPGGPDTQRDFMSDDAVALTGFAVIDGRMKYVVSEPFRLVQSDTIVVGKLTFLDEPPLLPSRLLIESTSTTPLDVGDVRQLTTLAEIGDFGADTVDVTSAAARTIYRTSNLNIVSISPDGLITARGPGAAFITATNTARSATLVVTVVPALVQTTIVGVVEAPDGTPAVGALVQSKSGGATVTDERGAFSLIAEFPSEINETGLGVSFDSPLGTLTGSAMNIEIVPGGFSDAGLIRLSRTRARPVFATPLIKPDLADVVSWAVGDLNGDGSMDAVSAGVLAADPHGPANQIEVRLASRDGSFSPNPVRIDSEGVDVSNIALGDFNNDGVLDLALAGNDLNTFADVVSVRLGLGDGSFLPSFPVLTGFRTTGGITLADVNNDGNLDLIAPGSVHLGQGNGLFSTRLNYLSGPSNSTFTIVQIATGDVDGDGFLDVIEADALSSSPKLTIRFGNGAGRFDGRNLSHNLARTPVAFDVTNFNFDVHADLVLVTNTPSGTTSDTQQALVFVGSQVGLFQAAILPINPESRGVKAADINNDGLIDVAVTMRHSDLNVVGGSLKVFIGTPDGSFDAISFDAPFQPDNVFAGDTDRDGITDLFITSGSTHGIADMLTVMYGGEDRLFPGRADLQGSFRSIADLDRFSVIDGGSDQYLLAGGGADSVYVVRVDESGSLVTSFMTQVTIGDVRVNPNESAVADFNGDGLPDFVLGIDASDLAPVYLSRVDGGFVRAADIVKSQSHDYTSSVEAGDINGDSVIDLVFYNEFRIEPMLGLGDGSYVPAGQPIAIYERFPDKDIRVRKLQVADVTGDGLNDAVFVTTGPSLHVLLGPIDNDYADWLTFPLGDPSLTLPSDLAVSDFNSDGLADVAASNDFGDYVSVVLGDSDSIFSAPISFPAQGFQTYITAGDADGDGVNDLFVGNLTTDSVTMLRGVGDGSFGQPQHFFVARTPGFNSGPPRAILDDINGDGRLDLVSGALDVVSVLFNQGGQASGPAIIEQDPSNGGPLAKAGNRPRPISRPRHDRNPPEGEFVGLAIPARISPTGTQEARSAASPDGSMLGASPSGAATDVETLSNPDVSPASQRLVRLSRASAVIEDLGPPATLPEATGAEFSVVPPADADMRIVNTHHEDGTRTAYRVTPSGMEYLGDLGGGSSEARAINASGDVAGVTWTADNEPRAFLFTDVRGMENLGVLATPVGGASSAANDLDDNAIVIGVNVDATGVGRAFAWRRDIGMIDLNLLLPEGSGWILRSAEKFDSRGAILGLGERDGEPRAFRLTLRLASPLPGDINGDGAVDSNDLALLITSFGMPNSRADLDGDGLVNSADLAIMLRSFGETLER